MKKNKRYVAIILVIAISIMNIGFLSGCSNNKKIVIWAYDTSAIAATRAVSIYKKNYPDLKEEFEVVTMGQQDMVDRIKTYLATNSMDELPDIFYDEDYNLMEYMSYYIDKFVDLTSYVNIQDYYSHKAINVTYNNKIYAIPYDSGVSTLLYRADIINDAGYSASDMENLTWSKFITMGQHVKQTTKKNMVIMCPEGDMEGRIMYQSAGTWFFDENGNENIENNNAFVKTFQTMKDAYNANIVYDAVGWDDYISALEHGNMACLLGASWWIPIIKGNLSQSGNWKMAKIPSMEGSADYKNYSMISGGDWFVLNKKNKNIAALFSAEMFGTNQQLANEMANEQLIMPANKNVSAALTTSNDDFFGGQDIVNFMNNCSAYIPAVKYGLHTYEITYEVGVEVGKYIKNTQTLETSISNMVAKNKSVIKSD